MKKIVIKDKIDESKRGNVLLILQEIHVLDKIDIYGVKKLLDEYADKGQLEYISEDYTIGKIANCCEEYGYGFEIVNLK